MTVLSIVFLLKIQRELEVGPVSWVQENWRTEPSKAEVLGAAKNPAR